MIRAVIFDCFGVMYLSKHEELYQSLLVDPQGNRDEIRDLVRQSEYGLISDDQLYGGISRLSGTPLEKVRQYLVADFARNEHLLEYAQQLRKNYKVGLLSNLGRDRMEQFFAPEEQAQFFDAVVVSSDVGMVKPHPEIYQYACRRLDVDTSEAVFVDDVEDNCSGARETGLLAIRYQSLAQIMHDLDQLLKVQ